MAERRCSSVPSQAHRITLLTSDRVQGSSTGCPSHFQTSSTGAQRSGTPGCGAGGEEVVGAPVVEEEAGGGTVVDDDVDDTAGAPVVDDDVVDSRGTSVVDDDVDESTGAWVVDDGGAVVTGRLVVASGRLVVERAPVAGAVGSGTGEVVGPSDNSTVVAPDAITARVSNGSAAGSPVGGGGEVVEEGGPAGEVGTSSAVAAASGIVTSLCVTSGERAGRQSTISSSAMAARVTAIRAFSTGRAIRTSLGKRVDLVSLDEATDFPVPTKR